jgi:hypothetical protein
VRSLTHTSGFLCDLRACGRYWDAVLAATQRRGLPHAAIMGCPRRIELSNAVSTPMASGRNHDAAPPDPLPQDGPGAKTNRSTLFAHEVGTAGSLSSLAPKELWPAVSVYTLDVLPAKVNSGLTPPLLTLYFLDSGGGGMEEQMAEAQARTLTRTPCLDTPCCARPISLAVSLP